MKRSSSPGKSFKGGSSGLVRSVTPTDIAGALGFRSFGRIPPLAISCSQGVYVSLLQKVTSIILFTLSLIPLFDQILNHPEREANWETDDKEFYRTSYPIFFHMVTAMLPHFMSFAIILYMFDFMTYPIARAIYTHDHDLHDLPPSHGDRIDRVLNPWNDLGILQLVSEPTRLMY
ncbi:hypothetical protein Tco_1407196 [Tanacetum coccineum]